MSYRPRIGAFWPRLAGLAAVLLIVATGGVSAAVFDPRDQEIDLAMGVLRTDPVLVRLLTEAPQPWPGPRGEQPFDQQPPAAQEELRTTGQGLICTQVFRFSGKPFIVCKSRGRGRERPVDATLES
jgi:hypothetical protein